MLPDLTLLYRTYEAFNARDIEAVLATMQPDVDWPNGWMGGRITGHDAIRDFWKRQWEEIHPKFQPEGFHLLPDDRLRLDIHQTVYDRHGKLLSEAHLGHVYTFENGLISKMEID